jgi:hypothetical protein
MNRERDTPKNDTHIHPINDLRIPVLLAKPGSAVRILAQALDQWSDNCPGAGWEHHNMRALATLVQTPAMGRLLALARTGLLAEEQEKLRVEGTLTFGERQARAIEAETVRGVPARGSLAARLRAAKEQREATK